MRSSLTFLASALSVANLALAAPFSGKVDKRSTVEKDGVRYNVFEHAATGAKLEFVNNSGICETTPGVNQYSGYLSVGTNMNMWYVTVIPVCKDFETLTKHVGSGCLRRGKTLRLRRLPHGTFRALPVLKRRID